MPTENKEVTPTAPLISDDQLAEISSFNDAVEMLARAGIEVNRASDYGDGFDVHDKKEFVGTPFLLIDFKVVPGEKSDYGANFVVIRLITEAGKKAILTDGSTGICDQIVRLSQRTPPVTGGIFCEKGLDVSEYKYVAESGEETPAKTYYIHGL